MIVGVDTHKHVHVAVAIDSWGIRLRDQAFVADSGGYQALITWAETHGRIEAFGVEGTGSYGAGLARAVRPFLQGSPFGIRQHQRFVVACSLSGRQRTNTIAKVQGFF